ncbi:MAG TPA: alpha/beta fold hydrolase, partial [Accumulibacter sp.]|nr:alpha/beta fold hydrolase [Accumulibacter sp.]
MKSRQLHVLHRPARAVRPAAPPLLFVHGGYVSSACWDIFFLPWFSRRGFDCHALDLSGHGDSEGRRRLDSFGL